MTRPAAALLRVSTAAQAGVDRYGLDVQRRAIRDYAQRNDLDVQDEYVDIESGASEKRLNFYRLLSEADRYQAVVFFDLTRLARSEELSHRFVRLLSEAGLELHATNRGVVEAGLISSIDMAMSAEERRKIHSRLRGGVLVRADKHKIPPQGMRLWGYRNVPKALPEIDPETAAHVRRLYALSPTVPSWRALSKAAAAAGLPTADGGTWAHNNIRRIITNPAYKGQLVWPRGAKTPSKTAARTIVVPAIVSESVWQAAQKPVGVGAKPKHHTALSGRLKCGACGFGFSVQRVENRHAPVRYYYRCNSRGRLTGKCELPMVRASDLEPAVESRLRAALTNPDELTSLLREAEQNRAPDPRLLELKMREAAFVAAFGKGDLTPDEFALLRRGVRAEIAALDVPADEADYPLEGYARKALTLPLLELATEVGLTVVVFRDGFKLVLGGV